MAVFSDSRLLVTGWDISHTHRSLIIKTLPPALTDSAKTAISADGFKLKSETHITVIGGPVGRDLSDAQFKLIRTAMRGFDFNDVALAGDIYLVAKPKLIDGQSLAREALVVPVSSATITTLLEKLSHQLYIPLAPYLHITLATRPDSESARRGIGIYSQAEFEAMSQAVYSVES